MTTQECPFIKECRVPKENYRCYDDMKYQRCIIYQRYRCLGYDIEHDDLAPEVENGYKQN